MNWRTLHGDPIPDLKAWIKQNSDRTQEVHVACDSIQAGKYTDYVCVAVVLNPPHGGRVAYRIQRTAREMSLRKRLLQEVWYAVEEALQLSDICPGRLTVHIDANPVEKHASSKYLQELVGMVVGQGFKAVWKPESWAASHVADHVCRLGVM